MAEAAIPAAEFTCVLYEVSDNIARITLNRPERRNALNPRAYAEIEAAFLPPSADAGRALRRRDLAPIPPSARARTSRR